MMLPESVEFLILGAGWTSIFLEPLLKSSGITFAATTTTGHDSTIAFKFDPESDDASPYKNLPQAKTILITFPLKGKGQSEKLVHLYSKVHRSSDLQPQWIQLGSTGIYTAPHWNTYESPYDTENARAIAEDELLKVRGIRSTVLNLAGLYGGERNPKNWVARVAKSKEDVKGKKALHLIHGDDVARALVAVHKKFEACEGKRWLLTDMWVYDWWSLMFDWGGKLADLTDVREMVFECMIETDCKAVPRGPEILGRVLDSRDFWMAVKTLPLRGRVN